MKEAEDNAQRSAASMVAVDGTVSALSSSTVARDCWRGQMPGARDSESRLERKLLRSGSRKNHGSAATSQLSSSKLSASKSSTSKSDIPRDDSPCSAAKRTATNTKRVTLARTVLATLCTRRSTLLDSWRGGHAIQISANDAQLWRLFPVFGSCLRFSPRLIVHRFP